MLGCNRLQHDCISLLIYKDSGPPFNIQLLPQPARNCHLTFAGEANRVRPRNCIHSLIIAIRESNVRLPWRAESCDVSLL